MLFMIFSSTLIVLIMLLFFLVSKLVSWNLSNSMSFECGYTSYFFSRFSFSMHYYMIGIIFLFLDLELCFLMPFFNENFSDSKTCFFSWMFVLILLMGIFIEWFSNKLEWKIWA